MAFLPWGDGWGGAPVEAHEPEPVGPKILGQPVAHSIPSVDWVAGPGWCLEKRKINKSHCKMKGKK